MAIEQGANESTAGTPRAGEGWAEPPPQPTRFRAAQHPIDRERAVAALLRQISSGLSAYRLFPGDVDQPTFKTAVQRVRAAAEEVLAVAPLRAEIHGPQFITEHGPVPPDDRIDRLALVCYDHRAEQLEIRGLPDAHDLAILYEALSRPIGDQNEGSGIAAALRVAGVRAISVSELNPQAQEEEPVHGAPNVEQRRIWEELAHPATVADRLAAGGLPGLPDEAAEELFARLKALISSLTHRQANSFELYERLHEVVASLPAPVRRALWTVLIERVLEDPLAERMVGTMTDAGLARTLVDLSEEGGPDPVATAARLAADGVRHDDLVELTTSLVMGRVEAGTIIARLDSVGISGALEDEGGDRARSMPAQPDSPVVTTLSSLLARGLLGMGQEDIRAIREAFPVTDADARDIALTALRDYLRIESDVDRFGEVMGVWVTDVTDTLRRRDEVHLDRMVATMEAALGEAAGPKRDVLDASVRRVLGRDVLAELIGPAKGEAEAGGPAMVDGGGGGGDGDGDGDSNVRLLRRFGEAAVDGLFDDLAREQDRGRRAQLLTVLAGVSRGHLSQVARRLEDPRWYVARNAVTVLSRSGSRDAVPLLAEASRHREPAVRREAVRGLVAVAGLDPIDVLLGAAADPDPTVRATVVSTLAAIPAASACHALAQAVLTMPDQADRRRALDALAHHPASEAVQAMERLTGRTKPRLPRRLRGYAKKLLKERKGKTQ